MMFLSKHKGKLRLRNGIFLSCLTVQKYVCMCNDGFHTEYMDTRGMYVFKKQVKSCWALSFYVGNFKSLHIRIYLYIYIYKYTNFSSIFSNTT
jgi:hypothetical protein